MAADLGYPAPRDRGAATRPAAVPRYERYETLRLVIAAGAAFQLLGRFSGRPDAIDLLFTGPPVEWRLSSRGQVEESTIRVDGLFAYTTFLSRDTVEARDPTGIGGMTATAVGKWAAREQPSEGADPEPATREY
ncbi:MAG TPA: hypothetical protein VGT02_13175 [Methylomirabilota bacterium]|jgi:hypothetical protein|nr:hypothetical protein [Methylomirabilota bacterium]